MAGVKIHIYEDVIDVTQAYFGPAARRFVDRQIVNHLGKEPERLLKKDLASLIDWIGAAMALLAEDQAIVNSYIADLRLLIEE